jgi:hypothetical protein
MVSHAVLSIALLLVIIIYWIYLVYKKNNIEGFAPNIETLIETSKINKFSIRVWDNQSYLTDLYPGTGIPLNYNECKTKTQNTLSACPLSIWKPSLGDEYLSIGDIMARTLSNPVNEIITDVRVPIKPGLINEKAVDTLGVKGLGVVEPEDFQYVGGFGTGKIADRLDKSERYFRLVKQIKFQANLLLTELNKKVQPIINDIVKSYKNSLNSSLAIFLSLAQAPNLQPLPTPSLKSAIANNRNSSLAQASNFQPLTITAKNLANEILQKNETNYNNFLKQIVNVDYTSLKPNLFYYNITKKTFTLDNLFLINNLLNNLPVNIKDDILKNISIDSEFKGYKLDYYELSLTNLSFITLDKLRMTFGTKTNSYMNEPEHNPTDLYYHSLVTTPPNTKYVINYNYLTIGESQTRRAVTTIGKNNEEDIMLFSYHDPLVEHPKTTSIIDITMSINEDYLNNISSSIFENQQLVGYNTSLSSSVNEIKTNYQDALTNGYKQLSIWKPIPPIGYVALGYVLTNDPKDMKPKSNSIGCVPKSCVKTFKRRSWDREKDMIFRYSDSSYQFAFYRNPYLGTIIVMDEKAQNGFFLNKTPDVLPYRNESDSLNWECFDIIPCIKESAYVDDLMEATQKSKQMCKAYKGMEEENKQNDESKKSDRDEELKMKKLIHQKDNYIKNLMSKLNKTMTEEELYKLLNQGLNRYKLRRKLEQQRKTHGAVADKLMSTRGLEIASNTPGDMSKFKELLQRLVIAQYTKQDVTAGKVRECPVCTNVNTEGMVRVKDTEMCYGCTAEAVREIAGLQKPQ